MLKVAELLKHQLPAAYFHFGFGRSDPISRYWQYIGANVDHEYFFFSFVYI